MSLKFAQNQDILGTFSLLTYNLTLLSQSTLYNLSKTLYNRISLKLFKFNLSKPIKLSNQVLAEVIFSVGNSSRAPRPKERRD